MDLLGAIRRQPRTIPLQRTFNEVRLPVCALFGRVQANTMRSTDNYLPRLRREFIRKEKTWTKLGNDRYAPGEEDGPIPWSCLSSTDKVRPL